MSNAFGETRFPIPTKSHLCAWCGGQIDKGERHAHFVGKWEGEFQNWRMHSDCYTVAAESGDLADGFSLYDNERPRAPYTTEATK